MDLINFILSIIGGFNNNVDNSNTKFATLLIFLCKKFGENIYIKYNEIIKIEALENMNNNDDNCNLIINKEEIVT